MMNTIINPSFPPAAAPVKKADVDSVSSTSSSRGLTPKEIGSLTPGELSSTLSRSELSSIAGTIASKLDQYISNTSNSTGNHHYASSEGNSVTGSPEEDDVALANNLQAISLAAQKISDNIYKEPANKKSGAPDGHQVTAENFESEKHFYPRVLNAQIHPMVGYFFSLGNERIIARFMHLNPQVNEDVLRKCLNYVPKHFQWAGMSLFPSLFPFFFFFLAFVLILFLLVFVIWHAWFVWVRDVACMVCMGSRRN